MYTCPIKGYYSNDLEDLAKYPTTRSIAQLLCDSWASCMPGC